jgi:hypothetical protein
MRKIIKFHMCKIILKIWYVVTRHIYLNLRSLISLNSNYIYSDTCVTVVSKYIFTHFVVSLHKSSNSSNPHKSLDSPQT